MKTLSLKKFLKKTLIILLSFSFFLTPLSYVYANPAEGGGGNEEGSSQGADGGVADSIKSVASCFTSMGAGAGISAIAGALGLNVPVGDAANIATNTAKTVKDCVLDGVANGVKRFMVRALVDTTVDWINGGFDGMPSFGDNINNLVQNTQNQLLEDLIQGTGLEGLCTGFELPIKFAIQLRFNTAGREKYTPRCTIDKIKDNVDSAIKDVENFYSWNNFLEVTTNSSNNSPYGVYYSVSEDIQKLAAEVDENLAEELRNNSGFLSMRRCNEENWRAYEQAQLEKRRKNNDSYGDDVLDTIDKKYVYDGTNEAKKFCPIITPGTILAEQLSGALGTERDEIVGADEFDEIISALINLLIDKLKEGGVTGFHEGGNRYSDVEDPAMEVHKKSYIKQYDIRAYDIAIKILESRERTVKAAKSVYNNNLICWNEKEEKMNEGKTIYKLNSVLAGMFEGELYMGLTQKTVTNAQSHLSSLEIKFENELNRIEKTLNSLKAERQKAADIQELIKNARNYKELQEIVNNSGIKGADLEKEAKLNREVASEFDKMINGTREFNNEGKSFKKGGIGEMLRYCESFDLEADEEDNIIMSKYSIDDPRNLESSGDIKIIDSYDPADEIRALEDAYEDYSYIEPGNDNSPLCQNSDTIECMGDLDTALIGEKENIQIDSSKAQIYTLSPYNRKMSRGTITILNENIQKIRASLVEDLIIDSADADCNQTIYKSDEDDLVYNTVGAGDSLGNNVCNVDSQKTYFLKIVADEAGEYSLFTYGDGSDRGDFVGGGGGSKVQECISGGNIVCRGELGNLKINGQRYQTIDGSQKTPRVGAGKTDVWKISSNNRDPFTNLSFKYVTSPMTISVSRDSKVNSSQEFCSKVISSGSFYLNEKKTFGQCYIEPNQDYYLRINSSESGEYGIFW